MLLLASLAGEHSLMIGVPGTAKSMIARRLEGVFDLSGSTNSERPWFQVLLMRFTKPDEIFGPLDLQSLKGSENRASKYKRNTSHYLPDASFAFLDEIFKANSAILNSLLTILNERKFFNDGEVPVDLISVVAASNELPRSGGGESGADALTALYDRFLVRLWVDSLSSEEFSSLLDMYCGDAGPADANRLSSAGTQAICEGTRIAEIGRIRIDEVKEAQVQAIKKVIVPYPMRFALLELRRFFTEHGEKIDKQIDKAVSAQDYGSMRPPFYVSDRRWGAIVKLMKVAAWYDNRLYLNPSDLALLQFLVPCDESDFPMVQETVLSQKTILGKELIENTESRVEYLAEVGKSCESQKEWAECILQLEAIRDFYCQSVSSYRAAKVESFWLTPAFMNESVVAAASKPHKTLDELLTRFGEDEPTEDVLINEHLAELRARPWSSNVGGNGEGESDDKDSSQQRSKLVFEDLGLVFSLVKAPSEHGPSDTGWPGRQPKNDYYLNEAPVTNRCWNRVTGEDTGLPNDAKAFPGKEALTQFLTKLNENLRESSVLEGDEQFSVRLMTLDEYRLALFYAARGATFESVKSSDQLKSKVNCADGVQQSDCEYPSDEVLLQCHSPRLFSILGMKPQVCIDEEGRHVLVGGDCYDTFTECIHYAHEPIVTDSGVNRDAMFRLVLESIPQ